MTSSSRHARGGDTSAIRVNLHTVDDGGLGAQFPKTTDRLDEEGRVPC